MEGVSRRVCSRKLGMSEFLATRPKCVGKTVAEDGLVLRYAFIRLSLPIPANQRTPGELFIAA